jgi:hypothetical protein
VEQKRAKNGRTAASESYRSIEQGFDHKSDEETWRTGEIFRADLSDSGVDDVANDGDRDK